MRSEIRFADEKILRAFENLKEGKTEDKKLYSWIKRALRDLSENPFCGIQIPKKLMPKEYTKKYGVQNVFNYNLPNAWRLIYSIAKEDILIVSIVLEWFNHKSYERRFNYLI